MNILELAAISGDSELMSYSYSKGDLSIKIEVDELNCEEYEVLVPTPGIITGQTHNYNVCFIKIVELKDILSVTNSGRDIYS